MRWERLFADLEAQLAAQERAEQRVEVADRRRRELAALDLVDRLAAHRGAALRFGVRGAEPVDGQLADVAGEWLLVTEAGGREALVAMSAVLWVGGLGRASAPRVETAMTRRLGLSTALRGLTQQRVAVRVSLVDGNQCHGTFDRVGADHVDLAEHHSDTARRAGAVTGVRTIAFAALAVARPV